MKKLPVTDKSKRRPPPSWEGLSSPLDLDKLEAEVNGLYVAPLRRLVAALCDEIRDLRKKQSSKEEIL